MTVLEMAFRTVIGIALPLNGITDENVGSLPTFLPGWKLLPMRTQYHRWAAFRELANEEDCAPELSISINWAMQKSQAEGRRMLVNQGFQYGDVKVVCFEMEGDDFDVIDLGMLETGSWDE